MKPSQVKAILPSLLDRHQPVMIWGPVGAGKSDTARQVAKLTERQLSDVRLSTMDTVDIRGFPVPDLEAGVMSWLPADFLPPMLVKGKGNKMVPNESRGILFLDELPSAPPAVQAAAYQLVLDRRIGKYELPENWAVVAAGNRASDRSIVHEMPAALRNRFIHIDFEVDLDDWYNWATENGVSEITRGFLRFKPGMLHNFDNTNPRAFPTPRSWSFVDSVLQGGHSPDIERELIAGTVGEGAAAEYLTFARVARELPTVDEILLNPDSAPVPTDLSARYAICTALDTKATPTTMERLLTYAERMDPEFQVLFARSAIMRDRDNSKSKAYLKWVTKNQDLLL